MTAFLKALAGTWKTKTKMIAAVMNRFSHSTCHLGVLYCIILQTNGVQGNKTVLNKKGNILTTDLITLDLRDKKL